MDYPDNRGKFLAKYPEYLTNLVLTNLLITAVKNFCSTLWQNTQDPLPEAIKSFILLELTNTRGSCAKVIQFLNESGDPKNVEIAKDLQLFNTSPGRTVFGDEIDIKVTHVNEKDAQYPNTSNYAMTKKPRGRAVVINVVPNFVKKEAKRFAHIFKEFIFDVIQFESFTINNIKQQLENIRDQINDSEDKDEALIVMVITHGIDEKIVGRDHPLCGGGNTEDIIPITDIVDIFKELEDTTKMFFFTCCRQITETETKSMEQDTFFKDKSKTNTDTFVYYSCAKGYETPNDAGEDYTPYGKALSESMAQYAHKEDLALIMYRTNQELRGYVKGEKQWEMGDVAPEAYLKGSTHRVFFNPGWYDGMPRNDDSKN